jgi:hypothetical protein
MSDNFIAYAAIFMLFLTIIVSAYELHVIIKHKEQQDDQEK